MLEVDTPIMSKAKLKPLLMFLVALPIIVHFVYLWLYAVNIPRYDDYEAILAFLNSFKNAPFKERISLLFIPHFEHRIATSRATYALYYLIFGNINFRAIIFFNFGLLLLLFYVLTLHIKKALPQTWIYASIVLSFGLFDLINCENADFAMSGIQNYGVILCFAGSMWFYGKAGRINLLPALLLQILCIYTSGNGHVGAFFIVIYTLFTRDKWKIITAIITIGIFSPIYYYHYEVPPGRATAELSKIFAWFFHTVGSHFGFDHGVPASIVMLLLLGLLLPVTKRLQIKYNALPLFILLGFIFASQGLMSVFRGNLPVIFAVSSRYIIYSHLLVMLIVVFMLLKIEHENWQLISQDKLRSFQMPVLAISMAIVVLSYGFNYPEGRELFTSMHNTLTTTDYFAPEATRAKSVADEACRLKIYCIGEHRSK